MTTFLAKRKLFDSNALLDMTVILPNLLTHNMYVYVTVFPAHGEIRTLQSARNHDCAVLLVYTTWSSRAL